MLIFDYKNLGKPLKILDVTVITDGGPWATHNMPCPVCNEHKAVANIDGYVFGPCYQCSQEGWRLKKKRWWQK